MNALNQVIIEGNVIRTPAKKQTPTGRYVCTLPIAVNRMYKGASGDSVNEVGYYDIQAWGEKFCTWIETQGFKGRGVRVVGRLKQDRWTSQDGKLNSKIYIVAEHVDFKYNGEKKQVQSGTEMEMTENENAEEELSNIEQAAQGIKEETEEDVTEF